MQATAIAQPNIALIKYWGKAAGEGNVPATPSLSITLDALTTTTEVENWPGGHAELQGPELMQDMLEHTERFDAEVVFDHIHTTDLSQRPFRLEGDAGVYTADAIVIATGSELHLALAARETLAVYAELLEQDGVGDRRARLAAPWRAPGAGARAAPPPVAPSMAPAAATSGPAMSSAKLELIREVR